MTNKQLLQPPCGAFVQAPRRRVLVLPSSLRGCVLAQCGVDQTNAVIPKTEVIPAGETAEAGARRWGRRSGSVRMPKEEVRVAPAPGHVRYLRILGVEIRRVLHGGGRPLVNRPVLGLLALRVLPPGVGLKLVRERKAPRALGAESSLL